MYQQCNHALIIKKRKKDSLNPPRIYSLADETNPKANRATERLECHDLRVSMEGQENIRV